MSRPIKDSDEELDVKPGRKTRSLAGSLAVDSPLRRSSRIKLTVKQNDSSPDSPLSDASSTSNTRTTRRRTINMDNTVVAEKSRTLRSRRNSVASDISEITEPDVPSTPTKRTRGNADDVLIKASTRPRRFTRAGSETKSPPGSKQKITRRTRASSMELENLESKGTPTRSRRRMSMLNLEATVLEEVEEMKIPVVILDRTLSDVAENNETEEGGKDLQNEEKKPTEDRDCVKGIDNNAADNSRPCTREDVQVDVPVDKENVTSNDNENAQDSEGSTDTVIEVERSEEDAHKIQSSQDSSKALGLEIESLLNNSIKEQDLDVSNKENQEANIINDSQIKETAASNITLQSPKPLFASNTNESIKERRKSNSETGLPARRDYSNESLELTDDVVVIEKEEITAVRDATDNLTTINTLANEDDEDSDNMQKLTVSTDTESLSETPLSETLGKKVELVEMCLSPNSDSSINIVECLENVNKIDSVDSIEISQRQNDSVKEIRSDECNEDMNSKMDISISKPEEIASEINEDSEKDSTRIENECEVKDEGEKSDAAKQTTEILSEALADMSSVAASQSSVVSEDETAHNLMDTEDANDVLTLAKAAPESPADVDPENSTSINKNGGDDSIKCVQSSVVTETPAEASEEVFKKEQSEKASLDDSSTLKEQFEEKRQPSDETNESEKPEEKSKENQDMEVDESDCDANTASLFQDIPAEEWKEKNDDEDKESVHSMSTEKLGNESETDCDLVLVDREAWLAAEDIKAKKKTEAFDYDSDDTVVLKTRRDSLIARREEKLMNTSKEESAMNVGNSKSLNISVKRRSVQQENGENDAEDEAKDSENARAAGDVEEDAEEAQNTQETKNVKDVCKRKSMKETDEDSAASECNVSDELAAEDNLSKSRKTTKGKDLNKSSINSSLHKSQCNDTTTPNKSLRKSLNKSVQDTRNTLEKSNIMESAKKRKSLNKSKHEESETIENVATPAKRNQCSNSSTKKRAQLKKLDTTEESGTESEASEAINKKNSPLKKTINASRIMETESDSDVSRSNAGSEDSRDETVTLPKFLFNNVSDSENESKSDKSIDSDIEREYNLEGREITEFSDDDVPGDECRASETELSDSDDNGSDLEGFVVDDDVFDEEEDEGEENEENVEDPNSDEEDEAVEEETEELIEEKDEMSEEEEMQVDEVEEETEELIEEKDETSEEEEMQVDEFEEDVEEKEEDQDEPKSIMKVNKSFDTSNRKDKSKSTDLSLSSITKNYENQKRQSMSASGTEKNEKEHNLSNKSLSRSLQTRKTKQKRVSNEFAVDAQQTFESPLFNKNIQRLNKSMECSTPKTSHSKKKLNSTLNTLDVSLETNDTIAKDVYSRIEKMDDTVSKIENSLKKLKKTKSKENLTQSELIELVEKTNVPKAAASKLADFHKSLLTPYSESPTVKYLRKERLNDSAPELKFENNSRKFNTSTNNERSNVINKKEEEENEDAKEPTVKAIEKVNSSLKKKLLKVADTILENDQLKKRKKRKKLATEKTSPIKFIEENLEDNADSQITNKKRKKRIASANIVPESEVIDETSNKKMKNKKKTPVEVAGFLQELCGNFGETEAGSNVKMLEVKKKKRKAAKVEYDVENLELIKKKSKDTKIDVPCEIVPNEKLSKKKRKPSSKDAVLQSEEIPVETIAKKKKKQKVPEDIIPQKEALTKKLSKKKQKSLQEDVGLYVEEALTKKSKKKQKLLPTEDADLYGEQTSKLSKKKQGEKVSVKKSSKKKIEKSAMDSDETADVMTESLKITKETKKKKQKENVDRVQKEKDVKVSKLESKNAMKKSNKVGEKRSVKRLSDEIIENLSDIPMKPLKKRKLSKVNDSVFPSRSMLGTKGKKNVDVENDFISVSSFGGTTKFDVVNLQKMKKKRKPTDIISFRRRMLARNSRQPVSDYLMYLEKKASSGKNQFYNKP